MNNKRTFFTKAKFISIGVIIGALGTATTTSIAAQLPSLIGKKIQAEYTINVDGKELDSKAIVVDGVSHLPVRKVSEIYGADIKVKDKTITMNTNVNSETSGSSTQSEDSSPADRRKDNSKDIEGFNMSLENVNRWLEESKASLEQQKKNLDVAIKEKYDSEAISEIKEKISTIEKTIKDLEGDKKRLEKTIIELEGEQEN